MKPDGRKVVFISHKWCRRDTSMVRKIVSSLGARGIVANSLIVEPVVASHSITGTERARIEEADAFVLLWTPEARASPGVGREVDVVRDLGRPVVLLKWYDTPPPEWWNADDRWVAIDRGVLMPCDSEQEPTYPGIIDFAFGHKDFGSAIADEVERFLNA